MSYALSSNMTYLLPQDAMRQVELVTVGIAQEMGFVAYLTSTWRLPRHPGDKSYHRHNEARDYDFHYLKNMGGGRINEDAQKEVLAKYKARLPSKWFDCINEGDHFHIEYDPKV